MPDLPPYGHEDGHPDDITELIRQGALDRAAPLIYEELERRARGILSSFYTSRKSAATVQTADLVGELYLSMVSKDLNDIKSRRHFFLLSSKVMLSLLQNHERDKRRLKRGGLLQHVSFTEELAGEPLLTQTTLDKLARALSRLEQLNQRQAEAFHLHHGAGRSIAETAELLEVSIPTVNRDLRKARLFLTREIAESAP